MSAWDTSLPSVMRELHRLEFDYANGDGVDFEPYEAFLSADKTASWFRAWTGNAEADAAEFKVFGQDGTGGYAAFWLVAQGRALLEQPVVFLGSEGEKGVVAVDFDEYLWLLAGGFGPFEAVAYPSDEREPIPWFTRFAQKHSSRPELPPSEVISRAGSAYPDFTAWIESLCR